MRKAALILTTLILTLHVGAQQIAFPSFLEGTWKVKDDNAYEQWTLLNEHHLKGFSYTFNADGLVVISEYLELEQKGQQLIYSATPLGQNNNESIPFEAVPTETGIYRFENPQHDFPNTITYQSINNDELLVSVEGDGKRFTMTYQRLVSATVEATTVDSTKNNPNYDPELANELGADDYGMKSYIFVILKTGTNDTTDKAFIGKQFRGHMNNINRLVEEGKLIVAGPLNKNPNQYRGLFIFQNVNSIEEAEQLLQTDPAIAAGLLDVEIYDWYGSAALPVYLKSSDKIWKKAP
tara:strand:+ start:4202 stop:5083 length:882 start_codon:yes stop_codon:yes gene_type:complete